MVFSTNINIHYLTTAHFFRGTIQLSCAETAVKCHPTNLRTICIAAAHLSHFLVFCSFRHKRNVNRIFWTVILFMTTCMLTVFSAIATVSITYCTVQVVTLHYLHLDDIGCLCEVDLFLVSVLIVYFTFLFTELPLFSNFWKPGNIREFSRGQ